MRLTTLPLIRIKEASTPCLEELGLWWPSRICLRGIVWADSGSDVRFWHKADIGTRSINVRF